MSTISSVGKIAYIYDQATDSWYPVAGSADATANYAWTGDHTFSSGSSVEFNKTVLAKAGVNSFTSVSDRNSKIPSPVNGTLALVVVNNTMEIQYFYNGVWNIVGSNAMLSEKTDASVTSNVYMLQASDAGRTLEMNISASHTIRIPLDSTTNFPIGSQIAVIYTGTGQPSFEGESSPSASVAILSKNGNKKISSRYSQAIIIKKAANTWYLMGDLTA